MYGAALTADGGSEEEVTTVEVTKVALPDPLVLRLLLPFAALTCFDDGLLPPVAWFICLYDLGRGFDCLVYPDPPPPLALEPVDEPPGECWEDIPPGPGPGPDGEDALVAELVP